MSTHKHIDLICICAIVLTLLITLLFMHGEAIGITVLADSETAALFTENDLLSEWNTDDATHIRLDKDTGTVTGTGAYISDGDVHISFAGKYVLSGELSNGSIIIDADGDDKIWLLLDGVSVHCEDNAAIFIQQARKVFLTLSAGKTNTLSGGAALSAADSKSKTDGVIYSRDDLTINGRGTLRIQSDYQHGIVCNDSLSITDGDIYISAPQDGIHVHDGVKIANASLQIAAGDDGITSENDDRTDTLYIASGTVTINGCYEGLEASSILIAGGTIDITPSDDGINAEKSIEITGGDIRIVNETGRDADGLDSNGDITIAGGKLFISVNSDGVSCALDYGKEQGGICRINGGTVIACGSAAMAEEMHSSSTQNFIMHKISGDAGSSLILQEQTGEVILSEIIPCSYSLVILSDEALVKGAAYSLTAGTQTEEIIVDNTSEAGGFDFGGGFGGFDRGKFKGQKPDFLSKEPPAAPAMGQMPPGDIPFGQNNPPSRDNPGQPEQFEQNPNINGTTFILIGVSAILLIIALLITYKKKDTWY